MTSSKRYPTPERHPWDVDFDSTKVGLERFARALISTASTMTDSFTIGNFPLGRGVTVFARVHIPEGREEEFDAICLPGRRAKPPKISLA